MSIKYVCDPIKGNSYSFDIAPTNWTIPPGYMIKMPSYPGKFVEVVAHTKEAWTGEGLPPVGSGICEYRGAHQWDVWTVVNIFAEWGEGSRRVVFVDFGDGWREERDPERFRQIRTPEQVAAEEREFEIIEIERVAMSGGTAKTMAEAIYDAGYRKQVKP